jgi:membrane-associated phospholipid phosphatase
LQRYAVGHDWLVDVVNWIYVWGHWPVITVVLLWTWRRHPSAYVVLRNALLVSGLIGVVIFIAYPVAPPRLADLGLLDTVTERSHAYRVLQPPAFVNQYAAIPSLHVGWDLLIGITVVRCSRRVAVRAVGVLLPVAMAISVVLSANHYVVDGVLGALVALVGLALARHLHRRAGRELPSGAVDMAAAETRADGTDGHHGPSTRSCLVEGVPDVTCGPTGRTLDPGRGP